MLSIYLFFFDKTEAGCAYKRYAYKKKNMYTFCLGLTTCKAKGIVMDPCPICGSKFTHVFRKNLHMKYSGKLLNCEICKKLFQSKQAFVGHHNAKLQRSLNVIYVGNVLKTYQNWIDIR